FGYRDNTYNPNNTNFIGDFDLEYLLNNRGTIRLKAYNRFNDRDYLRDALTTQGVGIVWKHDFDKPRHKGDTKSQQVAPSLEDSIPKREPPRDDRRNDSIRQPVPMVTLRPSQHSEPSSNP
ncbi:MAG: hypothetical protein IKS64_02220, partial [Muribaculaceae bacterium]|nr:hypothetical protein [Muribaculaceae bacterium]